jgi:hypothetical protein
MDVMARCGLLGHRYRFRASGVVMSWACERCGHVGGEKRYPTSAEALRYTRAFDREDRQDIGRRAPLVGLLPLRIARMLRRHAA